MQRYDSIVVGVDFTDRSRNALREAHRLAGPGGRLYVVHVVESQAVDELRAVFAAAGTSENDILTEAKVKLGEMVSDVSIAADGPQTHISVLPGHPADMLIEQVHDQAAKLLVMARNSASDPQRGAGATAVNCVRHAPTDVLLVREQHAGPYRRVLACVDFSPESNAAVHRAAAMAEADGADLHIAHAYRPPWEVVPFAAVPMAASGDYQTEHMRMLEEQLQEMCAMIADRYPKLAIGMHLEPAGSVGSTLVAAAESLDCDLVVLGTHGRGRIERLLLGSTAERVIRSAACSVLTVRTAAAE